MWGAILFLSFVAVIASWFIILKGIEEDNNTTAYCGLFVSVISFVIVVIAMTNTCYGYPVDRLFLFNGGYEVLYYNSEIPEVILLRDANGNCRLSWFYPEVDNIGGSKFVKVEANKIMPWDTTPTQVSAPADSQ